MCQDIPRLPRAKNFESLAGVITGRDLKSSDTWDNTQHMASRAIAKQIQESAIAAMDVNGALPPIKTVNDLREKNNWLRHY